jgi:hypothetical protein
LTCSFCPAVIYSNSQFVNKVVNASEGEMALLAHVLDSQSRVINVAKINRDLSGSIGALTKIKDTGAYTMYSFTTPLVKSLKVSMTTCSVP